MNGLSARVRGGFAALLVAVICCGCAPRTGDLLRVVIYPDGADFAYLLCLSPEGVLRVTEGRRYYDEVNYRFAWPTADFTASSLKAIGDTAAVKLSAGQFDELRGYMDCVTDADFAKYADRDEYLDAWYTDVIYKGKVMRHFEDGFGYGTDYLYDLVQKMIEYSPIPIEMPGLA